MSFNYSASIRLTNVETLQSETFCPTHACTNSAEGGFIDTKCHQMLLGEPRGERAREGERVSALRGVERTESS